MDSGNFHWKTVILITSQLIIPFNFAEISRLYPVSNLVRQAAMDYKVPGTEVVIRKGELVTIPVMAVHLDPKYFPNPDEFSIDRSFKNSLSFGVGPRVCIGERFALVELKAVVANFLKDYRVLATDMTPKKPFDGKGRSLITGQLLYLKIEKM